MNKSENLSKEVNAYLLNLDVVKDYKRYEKLIKQDESIIALEDKMKEYQKKIVNQKANQDDNVVETIEEYQKLKDEFESHPLVVNYLYLKQEVDDLLQSINTYINGQLLK